MLQFVFAAGVAGWCCVSSVQAQVPVKPLAKAVTRAAVENTVRKFNGALRVAQTYKQACAVQERCAPVMWAGPSQEFFAPNEISREWVDKLKELPVQELYPRAWFLEEGQLPDYILAKHNLEISKWFPRIEMQHRTVLALLEQFESNAIYVQQEPVADMAWLARQVKEETRYLLLGELHDPVVAQQIPALLQALRAQNPHRQIFLFTEFLPEEAEWGNLQKEIVYPGYYRTVFDTALQEKIRVFGLEPNFTYQTEPLLMPNSGVPVKSTLWSTIEGVRLRNEKSLQILQKYRQQYPDALFVVYAGSGHVAYSQPNSLGDKLVGENTLVALLCPEYLESPQNHLRNYLTTQFDTWTKGLFLQRVFQLRGKDLSRLAGFDVRIRIGKTSQ